MLEEKEYTIKNKLIINKLQNMQRKYKNRYRQENTEHKKYYKEKKYNNVTRKNSK